MRFIEKYVLLLNGILKLHTVFLKMQFKIYSVLSVTFLFSQEQAFRRVKNGEKPGFPQFKRKDVKESFSIRRSDLFGVFGRKLRISRLKT